MLEPTLAARMRLNGEYASFHASGTVSARMGDQ